MPVTKETLLEIAKGISTLAELHEHHGEYTISVPAEHLLALCTIYRDDQRTLFNQLIDATVIDRATRNDRFEVVYFLLSLPHASRVRVKTIVQESKPHCPSLVEVWESANWYEREAYDMYGVIFEGHPDLRRFYMPEDFVDPESGEPLYPLRKDFPVMGIPGSTPLPPFPEKGIQH
jgi:NADH-quinone oxidoreductase subunit C